MDERWRRDLRAAFAAVEPPFIDDPKDSTREYIRGVITTTQKVVCDFCRAPTAIVGNAWSDLTPMWLPQEQNQRPTHQPLNNLF